MSSCTLLIVAAPSLATQHLRQTIFARKGTRVIMAQSINDAKQKVRFARPDLVVAARELEGGGADGLCRWFRDHLELKNTPILILLDSDNESDIAAAKNAGASRVLVRSESPEVLTETIATMLSAPLRKEIRVPVEVRVMGEMEKGTLQGLTRDVSLSGALMEFSTTTLKSGDQLYVRLHLHGVGRPVVAKAECMRIDPDPLAVRVGVRFLHFDKNGKELLETFLKESMQGVTSA